MHLWPTALFQGSIHSKLALASLSKEPHPPWLAAINMCSACCLLVPADGGPSCRLLQRVA